MQPQPTKQPTREEFIESLFAVQKPDNFCSDKEARKKLMSGINKVVDVVRSSYGSSGSNIIIEDMLNPGHRVTNDGKTIAESIFLSDPYENIGANIVKEVANKSDKESGDGRKTSMILLQAILKEGAKCKEDPMVIKRSLDECLSIILKSIDDQTKQITEKEVGGVATVACEDKKLGDLFQEIYTKIGRDGIIELDNSGLSDTFYTITEGVRLLNCRFTYPYMANEDKGRKAIYKTPYILITKQKVNNIKELDAILRQVHNKGKDEMVIFCDEIDPTVSQALAFLHNGIGPDGQPSGSAFKTLVIKAPVLWKDWLFEDFAKITGATIIDPSQGTTLKNFQFSWLGYADKVTTSKDETVVIGIRDISEHLARILDEKTEEGKLRASRLCTKTAILKLGANSESELSYIKGKALDARNSSYLALQGGVVKGGGQALYDASNVLKESHGIGGKILNEALKKPNDLILKNSDIQFIPKDILDSAIVVKNAITNALSVASIVLTTASVITLKR